MLKSDFSGQVRGQWTLRNSSMRKTWILRFHPTSPAQPLVRGDIAFFQDRRIGGIEVSSRSYSGRGRRDGGNEPWTKEQYSLSDCSRFWTEVMQEFFPLLDMA